MMTDDSGPTPSHHSNRWYKKHPEAGRPTVQAVAKQKEPINSPKLAYLRATGFTSFVFSIGALSVEPYYWWFVGFIYLTILIFMIDCWFEKSLGWFQYVLESFLLAFMVLFTVGYVWPRYRPEFVAIWNRGDYTAGTDVAGMKWQDGWSELRFSVNNPYDIEMKDIEMEFRVEEPVADMKLDSSLPCTVVRSGPGPLGQPYMTDSSGKQTPMGKPIFEDSSYQLLCDKLPGHTSVGILLALNDGRALMNALLSGQKIVNVVSPKRKPQWVATRVKFKTGMRPYVMKQEVIPE